LNKPFFLSRGTRGKAAKANTVIDTTTRGTQQHLHTNEHQFRTTMGIAVFIPPVRFLPNHRQRPPQLRSSRHQHNHRHNNEKNIEATQTNINSAQPRASQFLFRPSDFCPTTDMRPSQQCPHGTSTIIRHNNEKNTEATQTNTNSAQPWASQFLFRPSGF
jgi:hypothetical protein